MATEAPTGLFGSLQRLIGTLVETVEVRLSLFGNELQQEKLRLLESLAWLALAMVAAGIGMLLLTAFVVLLFDERHRLAVLGTAALLYLGLAVFAWLVAKGKGRAGGGPFAASLAELRQDRGLLRPGEPPDA